GVSGFVTTKFCGSYGQKTGPGHWPEQELIALRPLMINQTWEPPAKGGLPASLIYVLIVSPSPAVASTFMPLPLRNTSAGRPVVFDTALLPCSFLPPSAKETRSGRSEGKCLRACFDENEPAVFNSPRALSLGQRAANFRNYSSLTDDER